MNNPAASIATLAPIVIQERLTWQFPESFNPQHKILSIPRTGQP